MMEARNNGSLVVYRGVPNMGRLGGPVVMKSYWRGGRRCSDRLNPRLDLINHSPDGLSWGYMGSGPHQCALALLADALGDDERAKELCHGFCEAVVSRWPMDGRFTITADSVREYADRIGK